MTSTRFPGKPMADILGTPMVIRVCQRAELSTHRENIWVATDSKDLKDVVERFGYKALLTSGDCPTGTDRVADAMRMLGLQFAINVQGDEPIVSPHVIERVAQNLLQHPGSVWNAYGVVDDDEDSGSKSLPKVVLSRSNRILYISRADIPSSKYDLRPEGVRANKQVCVYGFHIKNLDQFGMNATKSPLEQTEDIELIRFLENDIDVRAVFSDEPSISVDWEEDIKRVENHLRGLPGDE